MSVSPYLIYVDMKVRRAKFHLDELEKVVTDWIASKPYSVTHEDDLDKLLRIWRVKDKPTPELIPMLVGDFICCLRSALDQLAWQLAHFDSSRIFTRREERQIQFPIFTTKDRTYLDRLKLFTSTVGKALDRFQPFHRGDAFRDDPLWQLNELWTMDKHKAIPVNGNSYLVHFSFDGWERYRVPPTQTHTIIEVHFPLGEAWKSRWSLEPAVAVRVLFGDYMGEFEISMPRLKEINDFVAGEVIPAFAGFFD
jgi:hypothetical protein